MKKPDITEEMQYISEFMSQSYPESLDKGEHEQAQAVFEAVKESYPILIDALIDVLPLLSSVANGKDVESSLVKQKINKSVMALKKAGCREDDK